MIFPPSMSLDDAIKKVQTLIDEPNTWHDEVYLAHQLKEILSDLQELEGHIDDSCTD